MDFKQFVVVVDASGHIVLTLDGTDVECITLDISARTLDDRQVRVTLGPEHATVDVYAAPRVTAEAEVHKAALDELLRGKTITVPAPDWMEEGETRTITGLWEGDSLSPTR